MLAPILTDDDLLGAFQLLMPRGEVWPRDSDAIQTKALKSLMPTYTRSAARARNLLIDAFPASTLELLPEWEATLGLPDPCSGPDPSVQQRRAQVVARLTARGGQSIPYFIAFAHALGYEITITQYTAWRFGMRFGMPMCGLPWCFVWQVNAPGFTVDFFQLGVSSMGEAFATWGNTVLQCELERLKPAHTTLLFN